MKNSKWEGISLYQKVADVNMKKRKIEGIHYFKTCLKNIKKDKEKCLKYDCIIAKLIISLINK